MSSAGGIAVTGVLHARPARHVWTGRVLVALSATFVLAVLVLF